MTYTPNLLMSGKKRQRCDRPQTGVITPGYDAAQHKSPERAKEDTKRLNIRRLMSLSPFQGFFLHRIINGGLRPRLWSVVSSRLLVSPISCIIAQTLVHKRREILCGHFYRTPMLI